MKNLIFPVLLFYAITIQAQVVDKSSESKPGWFVELPDSEHYKYFVGLGENASIEKAKKMAIQSVLFEISREIGVTINYNSISETNVKNIQNKKSVTSTTDFEFSGIINETGDTAKIVGLREVESYWQREIVAGNQLYRYWVLVRKPKSKVDPDLPIYTSYGAAPIWRSAIFPGWGQIYKQENKKAYKLMVSEIAFISGAVGGQYMYNRYHEKAYSTTSFSQRNSYLKNRDAWSLITTTAAIGAGAVYVYNLIDAISSKGKAKYASTNKIQINPIWGDNSVQLQFSYNF